MHFQLVATCGVHASCKHGWLEGWRKACSFRFAFRQEWLSCARACVASSTLRYVTQTKLLFFFLNVAMLFVVITTYLYTSLSGVYLQRLLLRYVVRAFRGVSNVPRAWCSWCSRFSLFWRRSPRCSSPLKGLTNHVSNKIHELWLW